MVRLGVSGVRALWTGRDAGDQRGLSTGCEAPPPVPAGRSLRRMNQLHGARVLVADAAGLRGPCDRWPDDPVVSPAADAVISTGTRSCLVVLTADCASVAISSREGWFAALHVGWRGLLAGIVESTVGTMTALGATGLEAGLGPCIHPCCYGFEAPELGLIVDRYGADVRSRTSLGEPALDLPRAVHGALSRSGVEVVVDDGRCTACSADAFSYRARRDEQRQALLVWFECAGQHADVSV